MASLLFFINLFIFMIFPVSSYRNVTLDSSITAKSDQDTPAWASPSGEFAFGFRQVEGGGFLLAIWFDQIPEKTIVWTANRDNPVPSGSRVHLSETLELLDEKGSRVWAATLVGSGALAYAAMLDTGNFVLTTNNSMMLWQSFDSPTDTLLPGQTLYVGEVLISSFSETNHSKGRFILTTSGNLGLYTRDFPWDDDTIYPYWLQVPDSLSLIFNLSGYIYRIIQNGTRISPFDGGSLPVETFLQRLTLGYDGVFRHYVYPKLANSTGGRPMKWSMHDFIPQDVCMGVIDGGNGGGICGFNSHCSVGTDSDRKTVCKCPKGYVLVDQTDSMSGCRPDFELQSCDPRSKEADFFEFSEFLNTNFPYVDYEKFEPVEEDYCRQNCLDDCICALVTYTGGTCWKKQLPMINGRTHPSIAEKALVKMRKNGTLRDTNLDKMTCSSKSKSFFVTSSIMMATSMVVFLVSVVFWVKSRVVVEAKVPPGGMTVMRSFSFTELQEITDGFRNELGRGACARVYRGDLKDSRQVVAVKKLDKIPQESNIEFIAEVKSISKTHHKNLVQLLGYCDEDQYRILVYEFMPYGSLADFIFKNSSRPNWYIRVQIAFAIARGLCYLHEDCITPIIHCDIKPQNVLLGESYTPKIADFGLAKLLRPDQTKTTTRIRGTRGYVAPEWFRNMPITVKVDVYSFGILLLELLFCRKNFVPDMDEPRVVLADWVFDCYQEGNLALLVAEEDEAINDMRLLERFVSTAIWCIQEDPTLRPHMKRAVHMLEGSIEVPVPPNPFSHITTRVRNYQGFGRVFS